MEQTPFELRLRHDLDVDFRRMDHDWFFRWHSLNIQNALVDVDAFDGSRISVGGIFFEGQIQQAYWRAVERFLRQKVHETFADWKTETADYPLEQQQLSLEGAAASLGQFCCKNHQTCS